MEAIFTTSMIFTPLGEILAQAQPPGQIAGPALIGAVVIMVVLFAMGALFLSLSGEKLPPAPTYSFPAAPEASHKETKISRAQAQPVASETPSEMPPPGDDLRKIEGIGPKIAELLQSKGIRTFDDLAAADVERLNKILDEAGLQFANPESWPRQAELAAQRKWDELQALQDELTAGRAS